ncbi:MAG: DNA-binding protein [Deltaproteobacteria bacterium]|nr:DNA-binding protein [Deltaproteobacteria bacterium]MBW2659073.1 DNA-binding protein [Deltaproteobacteria bacterium]
MFFFFLFSVSTFFTPATADAFAKNNQTSSGTIIETMNSSGYTYMLVESNGEKTWVAIPETKVEKGAKITYDSGMLMKNFNSKTLNRTFDSILFSSGIVGEKDVPAHGAVKNDSFSAAVQTEQSMTGQTAPPTMAMGASGGSLGAITPFKDITAAKTDAPNGYTVAELFAQAKKLNGQKIALRGIVTKVSANIMGRNWIHLQDGTGDPMQNTHDIVATSSDYPELNSEITIKGTVAAEKDFGSGYKYAVIIEEATVQK